jgi:hypothetical protein
MGQLSPRIERHCGAIPGSEQRRLADPTVTLMMMTTGCEGACNEVDPQAKALDF